LTKIYYFSGTGNSLWSAQKIAQSIDGECELINIGDEVRKNEIIVEADAVVLVFPSYAYGLPLCVRCFAQKAVLKTRYIAAFVTFGSSPGGTLGALRRILKRKKINNCFYGRIPAPENYLALFGVQKPDKINRRLSMQREATEEAVRVIIERRENSVNTFCPFSGFVWTLFSLGVKILYKFYRLSGDCNGCGICAKICPVSAITMRDGRPVFSKKCEHCQGCVNICPLRAIQFGRAKFGAPGYCNPALGIDGLAR
jgi:ferredoxin